MESPCISADFKQTGKATKASVFSLVGPHSKGAPQVRPVIEKCELLKIFKIFTFFSGWKHYFILISSLIT